MFKFETYLNKGLLVFKYGFVFLICAAMLGATIYYTNCHNFRQVEQICTDCNSDSASTDCISDE
jgi:hypothetical protein